MHNRYPVRLGFLTKQTGEPDRVAYARRLGRSEEVWVTSSLRRRRGRRWWGIRRKRAGKLRAKGKKLGQSGRVSGPLRGNPVDGRREWLSGGGGRTHGRRSRGEERRVRRRWTRETDGAGSRERRGAERCSTGSAGVCGMHQAPVVTTLKV